jgi:hypothetical protein
MAKHGSLVDRLKSLGDECKDNQENKFTQEDRTLLCSMIVHGCDLGNLVFEYDHSYKWGLRISQEFHDQYQAEDKLDKNEFSKPMEFMKYSDDETFYKNQTGFIDNVVIPMWQILYDILKFDKVVMENLETNRSTLFENSQ